MKDYSFEINAAVCRLGQLALEHAQQVVPVRTGKLKRSLHITETKNHATGYVKSIISTNVHYAKFVELGRKTSRPHPYLAPAAEFARSKAAEVFAVYLGGYK